MAYKTQGNFKRYFKEKKGVSYTPSNTVAWNMALCFSITAPTKIAFFFFQTKTNISEINFRYIFKIESWFSGKNLWLILSIYGLL